MVEEFEEKKEVQGTIVPTQQVSVRATEDEIFVLLRMIAPGTSLRSAVDGAMKNGKGALIVIENERLLPLLDGGFRVNCRFTPQRLMELVKMDGAIVLSSDLKRINYANVLLTPDTKIKTAETGTRHKAAERTAKQTGTLVVAISERRNEIHLFYKNIKYLVKSTGDILRKANEHLQMLEKQRDLFDKHVDRLTRLELRNHPSLGQGIAVIQKGRIIQKVADEMKRYILEAGVEGALLKTRLKEITTGVERETTLVIKDYTRLDVKRSKELLEDLSYDDILDAESILSVLAYESAKQAEQIKGWRILSKTSLEDSEIATVVRLTQSLGKAINSNQAMYFETLGEEKARAFKEEVDKIKMNH